MADVEKKEPPKVDTRSVYFKNRLALSFGIRSNIQAEKFNKSFEKEENQRFLTQFFSDNGGCENMFAIKTSAESCDLSIECPHPDKFKTKGIVVLKITSEPLTAENIGNELVFFELSRNILEHCYSMFHDVIAPVIQNPINQVGQTDLVTKDLMEKFNNFIAHLFVMMGLTKGRTMLPMPSGKLTSQDTTPDKDKAHVFESSIITWTKQIKNVLKLEPEQALKQGNDPGPLTELAFWENKSHNLNLIYDQLQSPEVRNILRFLEGNKSTYTNPFSKLQKDVLNARIEANDNSRYLKSLSGYFNKLTDSGQEFRDLHELFVPIMHTILMIWNKSRFYNTPPRLVVLIREICNAIIFQSRECVSGPAIFAAIQNEDSQDACEKLQTAIDVCTKFKDAYFEYKSQAQGTWKLTANALFVRLDSFLERAHDILHLTNTIVQFNKLQKIELGGTKGKTLTETIQQIFVEFQQAVNQFQEVKYDIMDIEIKEFDDDFYEFRAKIKELERRLASVITQGFDDCDTINGRFKLLDSFEGLLNRPIIQDELEKKHIVLLEMYKQDLKHIQTIFLEGKLLLDSNDFAKAPIYANMPPISGALTWCAGLKKRMNEPLENLANLGPTIDEREEYKDVIKLNLSIAKAIYEYEQGKILAWEKEVEMSSIEKLKLPLLTKDENGLLKVNFDPALIRLLREVYYLQKLHLDIPPSALEIFEKDQIYRVQIVSLDLIVGNYNEIITCLHPVEEPLIKDRIEMMDVALYPALEELKWKSDNINKFIQKAKDIVDSTFEVVTKMKESINKVRECLKNINMEVIQRKNKPMSPDDYSQIHQAFFSSKQQIVKENGQQIHKLIKEVHDAIKIDKKSPLWKAYVDYVNEIVLDGIAAAITTALRHLNDQIDHAYIKKNDLQPIFDVKIELQDQKVGFDPPIDESKDMSKCTVVNCVKGWISDFYQYSFFITRLDKSDPSDYLQELRDYFELKQYMAMISNNIDFIESECKKFIERFDQYSYLWLEDPQETFNKFLIENEPEEDEFLKNDGDEQHDASANPLLKGCRQKIPMLDLFDEKITMYKNVQQEISKFQSTVDIVWLRISLTPLKSSLSNRLNAWINTYTNFLVTEFQQTLKNLKGFVESTRDGIKDSPADDEQNKELLMKVMKIISEVQTVEPKTEGIIHRMKQMIITLKKQGIVIAEKGVDAQQEIDSNFAMFKDTTKKVLDVKNSILPLQILEQANIKANIWDFARKVREFRQEFNEVVPQSYSDNFTMEQVNNSYAIIEQYNNKLNVIKEEAAHYKYLEKLFDLEPNEYRQLKECTVDLKNTKIMWDAISIVKFQYADWQSTLWKRINADLLQEKNKVIQNQLKNLKEIRNFRGYNAITAQVKNMGVVLPLVSSLHSEFMEKRHWQQMQDECKKSFDNYNPQFNFKDILDLELFKYENAVNEIVDVAQKEAKIEKKLKLIDTAWQKQIFEFEDYGGNTKCFAGMDPMLELLDQNSMDLQGMKSQGKYVAFFIDTVEDWIKKLNMVQECVKEWTKVQKNWKLLVNIFMKSEDIKQQLAEETKEFEGVDSTFREMMNDTSNNPAIVEACTQERLDVLKDMSAKIKRCEKSLNEYLEQKKRAFPRFYFLSDQSLLTILSNGTNPPKVCEFIGDCFDGLKTLIFRPPPPGTEISKTSKGIVSKDGEEIMFAKDFVAEGQVEIWCSELEFQMRQVLYQVLEVAKQTSELWDQGEPYKPREMWLSDYCAQISLLVTTIVWTEDVVRAFDDMASGSETAMREAHKVIEHRIEQLIKRVRGDLPQLERNKIINIITIDVHSRDVIESFCIKKVTEPESFNWLSQLKFYWENKDPDMASRQNLRFSWEKEKEPMKCIIRIVDWIRFYSFEYTGNAIRLVITPLTDRCYITLTQALNLTMGGAPAGPAGTGKTETTKDLGRGVGIPVMVFNCSDQMRKDSMAQIFMGLSQSGAWGCFDEFNRISIEVLSVVSTQVKCVLDALSERKTKFHFCESGEIGLVDTVGFYITMNPGYAGRTELPENLKALFRSCAMVTPDLTLICENMLMSEGFSQSRMLARKFVCLYTLSRELLSKARHYDWGLRAVKSVLRQAGQLKRSDPDLNEDPLLMRALRDFNLPKIVIDDKPIFLGLINDLFPRQDCPYKVDQDLEKLITNTVKKDMGLIAEPAFVTKVVSLVEILQVRHCVFIIGPPGCGKSEVWKTLRQSEINRGKETEYDTVNPKAVNSDELYGCYSKSKEWKNGVLSMFMKNQNKCEEKYVKDQVNKWCVLDGDIDPEWIESLNTVMDDNKVLTLVSNDRIPLTPSMRLVFEISNLKNATPATVSRAGVLFINENDIGYVPYVTAWLNRFSDKLVKKRSAKEEQLLRSDLDETAFNVFFRCFQSYIEQNQDIQKIRHIAPTNDITQVISLCNILDQLLIDQVPHISKLDEEQKKLAYEALFMFAGMWAFGGSVGGGQDDEKDQKEFNQMWRSVSKGIKYPEHALCQDFFFDSSKMQWVEWKSQIDQYNSVSLDELSFSKIYVETLNSTKLKYMLNVHVDRFQSVLFIGNAGSGKTAVTQKFLQQADPTKVESRAISFNSFTDSISLQASIESMVQKKSGITFGSAANKTLIYFIDDMNMPYVDKYGTQTPIALLSYIFDYASVFNREQLEERKLLQDLLFLGAMNPKAGSFTIDLRLQRHFTVLTMFTPSQDTIRGIYEQILSGHVNTFSDPAIEKLVPKLIHATIHIFNKLLANTQFSPSSKKFFYQFNLRDLSKICEGCMMSTPNAYRNNVEKFITLYVHETKRAFEDRMINSADIMKFRQMLKECVVAAVDEQYGGLVDATSVCTSFVSIHNGLERQYVPVKDMEELKLCLEDKLTEHNETKSVMNLVLFNDAMEHISRIVRILEFPVGNALLVGVGGSGKQSLSKLACFILSFEVRQIVVTSSFNINDLKIFLQEIYKKIAKPSATPIVFILTDSQIKSEQFLIPINDILNNGWIQDLFPKEDVDAMIGNLRNEAKGNGVADTLEALTEYFLSKMKMNMKLILCFSPVGDNFRIKSRKFPGLISSTSIDQFHAWPYDALVDVANNKIQDVELHDPNLFNLLAQNMANTHTAIDRANERFLKTQRRYNYTTPKSFLELIEFYKNILEIKRDKILSNIQRYEQGLDILRETQNKVEGLQEDLKITMIDVVRERTNTDALIKRVGEESAIASVEQDAANIEEEQTNIAAAKAGEIKKTAETALAEAEPALIAAQAAAQNLNKGSITEMKALGSPPALVILTSLVIMTLLGEKVSASEGNDKIWKKATQAMNNPGKFIERLQTFDGENIDEKVLTICNKIFSENPDYNVVKMKTQNAAALNLCDWSLNIIKFNQIYKNVKPLQDAKQAATEELELKNKQLAAVMEKVRLLNEKVAQLKTQLIEAETKKQLVEDKAEACEAKLNAAIKLVNGLSGENTRWKILVKELMHKTQTIIGDCLLASAFVSYIGAFTLQFRVDLWSQQWLPDIIKLQIPITDNITPLEVLTTESQKAQWKNEDLPADSMSIENATIITSAARWPLIIDPQLQGQIWLRRSLEENLVCLNPNQKNWLNTLNSAISNGKAVMLEGIQQEIDATLDPLMQRAIKKNGKNFMIEMGGDPVDYDPKFKLILITKMFNPHFRPEIAAQATLINFIVTELGLEEQLLAAVVMNEKPELEQTKQELVKKQNDFQVQLNKLEEDLLQLLSEADPATILDNKELIQKLDETKVTSNDIALQQDQAKITEVEINNSREFYRMVATEGAMLYFLIIQLNFVQYMYQYSLDSFKDFFFKAIKLVKDYDEHRINNLCKQIRYTICQWIIRGLFEQHKLIFLTLLTFRLMQKKALDVVYQREQMDFLVQGKTIPGVENPLEWLPQTAWDSIQALNKLQEFQNFAQNMEETPNRFKEWYNELAPEEQKLPLEWGKKLEQFPFLKLLVLRCLRPDRMTIALSKFIERVLPYGIDFIEMDKLINFNDILEQCIIDSEPKTPIFFILSPGADPVKEVEKCGKKRGIFSNQKFFFMALGEGQDEIAKQKIQEGNKQGHWIMLENIHLMPVWLLELEKILDHQNEENSGSPDFRMFFSADPSLGIPISLLERSIKLTNEPPAGLKNNMNRAWTYFSKEEIEEKEGKVKSILFALCFFHSTLLERRRFGPKGWNMSYPFSIGDLRDSYLVLNKYMENNQGGKVPFDDLIYIFGEIMYGGHIVNDWDRRLTINYLYNIMNDELFDEIELFPYIQGKNLSFTVPAPNSYEKYLEHIEQKLTVETPLAYGLHSNTEIGFRTTQCNTMFVQLMELTPKDDDAAEAGDVKTPTDIANEVLQDLLGDKALREKIFNLEEIKTRIDPDSKGPYQGVFLQEVEYMNILITEMCRSLEEIDQGIKGILTISEKMESIINALALGRVPIPWSLLAYPSKRGLGSWLINLFERVDQLNYFKNDPTNMPKVIMISRFFNPQSYLTAIQQVVGRVKAYELNKLYIKTEIVKKSIEELNADQTSKQLDGAYVFGFILDGARWDYAIGILEESKPKEMYCVMPVTYCRAELAPTDGRVDKSIYECPVYKTEDRGGTYVFTAQLKTKLPPRKWILGGVVMLLDVEGVNETPKAGKDSK